MNRRTLPLVVWIVCLVAGTALFHAMGDGPLAAPPLSPSTWGEWVEGRDPLVATVAVLRLVVLALSWYLVGATSIGILARLLRAARLVRIADALTVPALRRLLQGALGMSLATAMVAAATPHSLPVTDDAGSSSTSISASDDTDGSIGGHTVGRGAVSGDEVVLASRGAASDGEGQVTLTAAEGDGEVSLEHRDAGRPMPLELLEAHSEPSDRPDSATDDGTDGPDGPGVDDVVDDVVDEDAVDRDVAADDAVDGAHVVASGESLWTIARDVVAEGSVTAPSDGQVTDYWLRLIEENRERLDDPDNPDLIFPGQELVLPSVDGAAR